MGRGLTGAEDNCSRWRAYFGRRHRSGPAPKFPGQATGAADLGRYDRRTVPPPVTAAGPVAVELIRNFSIISHVDHGKSTLSDRILEITGAVDPRLMREQYLDSMDIERERGITIKAQNVRVVHAGHILHLIDTPGHVDFGYEVSRSLAACEGAVLLVDASQGIQAQTLANCYQAIENDLEIVPVLNKIDLPAADPERCALEIEHVLGLPAEAILHISAKTGEGVPDLLDAIIARIPPPKGDPAAPLRALIFDSSYDQYRGVVSSIRIVDGSLPERGAPALHAGQRGPRHRRGRRAHARGRPGGRLWARARWATSSPGSRTWARPARARPSPPRSTAPPRRWPATGTPSPWCSAASTRSTATSCPTCATPSTSSSSTTPASPSSPSPPTPSGIGFRCGFLGLLHMEIVRERLEREFNLSLIATAPSVEYRAFLTDGTELDVDNPTELPDASRIDHIDEPMLSATIITPTEYTGTVMELCQSRRGEMTRMEYLSPERVELVYRMPLAEVVIDFFDQLKSRTKGYASLDYEPEDYATANLVRVDILINHVPVDAFSTIVHRATADTYGRKMAEKLRELIPRQLFDVPIQAAIGGRIVARETVKAKRKDVLAKCYGGDITRKRKLLEKQKEGKKKMKTIGRVEVPQEAFISALAPG